MCPTIKVGAFPLYISYIYIDGFQPNFFTPLKALCINGSSVFALKKNPPHSDGIPPHSDGIPPHSDGLPFNFYIYFNKLKNSIF